MSATSDIEKEAERRRLAWRCRRGLLELDIVLQRFVETQFYDLNAGELKALDAMLDLPDNQFWALVNEAHNAHNDSAQQSVLCKMRAT